MSDGKLYYARHMQPGLVGYENETLYVSLDTIKRMLPSFIGKPVYIGHKDAKQRETAIPNGYITKSFYNELDGWAWVQMILVNDEGNAVVNKGWAVSNGYQPTSFGPEGMNNNVPFNRELTDGYFTHKALVPDPRYEEAAIFTPAEFKAYQEALKLQLETTQIHNSKTPTGETKMKLFKTKREEVNEIDADTEIEINGKAVKLSELVEKHNAKEKKNAEEKKEKMNAESMVSMNGCSYKLGDLVKSYLETTNASDDMDDEEETPADKKEKANKEKKNKAEKKNADDDMDDKKTKDEKENEADDEDDEEAKKAKADKEKENALKKERFNNLKGAHLKGGDDGVERLDTRGDQLKRGQEKYGKKPS